MSVLISAAMLASLASAQLTTTMWMPGAAGSNMSVFGSVVSGSDDRTTVVIEYQDPDITESDYFSAGPQTMTMAGNTYVGFQVSEPIMGDEDKMITISGECSRANTKADPTCVMMTSGLGPIMSQLCEEGGESDAEYCTGTEGLDSTMTTTLPSGYFADFPLTITAGEDNLPSAAATPSAGSASATSANSGSATESATGTGKSSTGAAPASGSASGTAPAEATGAAPIMTMAPALAGLGAAAAFFL